VEKLERVLMRDVGCKTSRLQALAPVRL